jgi:hypothetical protein
MTLALVNKAIVLGPAGLTVDERRVIQETRPDLAAALAAWTDPADDIDYRRRFGESDEEWERRTNE